MDSVPNLDGTLRDTGMAESKTLLLSPFKKRKQLSLTPAVSIFSSSQQPQNKPTLLQHPDRRTFVEQANRGGCHGTIDNAVDQ